MIRDRLAGVHADYQCHRRKGNEVSAGAREGREGTEALSVGDEE